MKMYSLVLIYTWNIRRTNMITLVCLLVIYCSASSEYITPTVNLTSCMYNTAKVTITNAPEGGLMFFRTDTAYNVITSTAGTMVYECTFEECNINWDEKFFVIVQRKVLYQTRDDVIMWFICNSDFGAVQPVDIDLEANFEGNLTTVTYKPEVAMKLYSEGERLDSGSEVKLGDEINMIILVTNNENDYFDIVAKSCYASGITLIEDRCPTDDLLFGLYNSTAVGYLSNTFSMFRPTNTAGGPTEVVFTCILEVCMWNCPEIDCSSNNTISAKRRRRDAEGGGKENIPNVVRGYRLVALAEGEETPMQKEEPADELCIPLFVIIAAAGASVLTIAIAVTVFTASFKKILKYSKTLVHLRKLNAARLSKCSQNPTKTHSISHVSVTEPIQCQVYGNAVLMKGRLQQPTIPNPYRRKSVTLVQ